MTNDFWVDDEGIARCSIVEACRYSLGPMQGICTYDVAKDSPVFYEGLKVLYPDGVPYLEQ